MDREVHTWSILTSLGSSILPVPTTVSKDVLRQATAQHEVSFLHHTKSRVSNFNRQPRMLPPAFRFPLNFAVNL